MGNIAKPIVEGSNIQQILPFKLSQKDGGTGTGSSTSSSGHSNSMKKAGSPRTGYQVPHLDIDCPQYHFVPLFCEAYQPRSLNMYFKLIFRS